MNYFAFILFSFFAACPALAGMKETTAEQESAFIPLNPPPAYSYQQGTLTKFTNRDKRYIQFKGTTAMPPYFAHVKNSLTFERPAWDKQLLLSTGRLVFQYRIDCDDNTFDRDGDHVGWRKTNFDLTAFVMRNMFCAEEVWSGLPDRLETE